MKTIIKLEETGMFVLSIFILYKLEVDWWFYLILLLGPDISMLGYIAHNKAGAFCYNLLHHKGIGVVLFLTGVIFNNDLLVFSGVLLFGHSSMDRMFGYGLKYKEGFKFTHLGTIGKRTNKQSAG